VLIGEASIRIDAQTAGLKQTINKDLNDALGAVKPNSAPIEDLDRKTQSTDSDMKKLGKSIGDLFGPIGKVASGAASMWKPFAIGYASTQFLPGLISSLISMSGALFLAVPAAFAFGGALAVMKLGADGAKAAFDKLDPTMTKLKKSVSDSFQKSLQPAVAALIVLLPQLTGGLDKVATSMGGVATKIATFLKSNAAVQQLQTILAGTAKVIDNVGAAFAPLIAAFLRIGAVAMPILVQLTSGIGGAADKFNALIQRMADTGSLTAWIQDGIAGFKSLFSVIGDLGSIIKTVFEALQIAGGGLTGTLGTVISTIKTFLQSAQGSQALQQLAGFIGQLSTALGTILLAALKAVAPSIPGLVTALSALIAALTPTFVTTVTILGTAFSGLATYLGQNIKWIGPLAIAVGAIAAGMKVWAIATAAQTLAQGLLDAAMGTFLAEIPLAETAMLALDAAMDANPIGLIVVAIAALVAIIIVVATHLDFFKGIWNTVWKFCSDVVTKVVDTIKSVFGSVVTWLSGVVTSIGNFFKSMGSKIADAFNAIINFFKELPGKIGTFLASLPGIIGKALLDALKFGANAVLQGAEWIVAEIIALPIQIGYGLVKLGEILVNAFVTAWNAVIAWIPGAFDAVVTFFKELPGKIVDAVASFGEMIGNWAKNSWNTAWKNTSDQITILVDFVKQLPGKIMSGITSLLSSIGNFFKDAWNSAWKATSDGVTNVVNFIKGLPGKVLDGLGDLGSLLAKAGKAIVQGFIDGIKAAWHAVTDVVSGLLDKVRKLLPFSPAKEGPFSGRGWVLYSGMSIPQAMADGIKATQGKAVAAALGLATAVNRAITSQSLSVGNVSVGVPSAATDAATQAAESANSTNAAMESLASSQGNLGKTIADALTQVSVVVSATDVNNKVTKIQNTDARRR
jgi:phage-related protein